MNINTRGNYSKDFARNFIEFLIYIKKLNMENTILFIMGVSGSGKSTLLDGLFSTYKNLAKVQSYTSRPQRMGEVDGDKYNFISVDEFKRGIINNEFLEYALVHQKHYYGTKKQDIRNKLDVGLVPVKEIDMQGLEKLKREDAPVFNYFSIFLDVPEEVMIQRIKMRGEMLDEELNRRIASSYKEREKAKEYCDAIIDASGGKSQVIEQVYHIIDHNFKNL
ncbi:MAG: guanylate kinase [candidate division SR1 bacterium]|nr:MAG: guanylate kinase [candidate division SR1 bacterium]